MFLNVVRLPLVRRNSDYEQSAAGCYIEQVLKQG